MKYLPKHLPFLALSVASAFVFTLLWSISYRITGTNVLLGSFTLSSGSTVAFVVIATWVSLLLTGLLAGHAMYDWWFGCRHRPRHD
jgi:hypothetical protein